MNVIILKKIKKKKLKLYFFIYFRRYIDLFCIVFVIVSYADYLFITLALSASCSCLSCYMFVCALFFFKDITKLDFLFPLKLLDVQLNKTYD